MAFFEMLRPDRTVMVAMVTAADLAASAGVTDALWMTIAGCCLAAGGFSPDFYADRDLDTEEPRIEVRLISWRRLSERLS